MYVCGEREREDLYVYLDTDNPRKMGGAVHQFGQKFLTDSNHFIIFQQKNLL